MMNSVVHFEMPYEDKNRMADFYGKAFGWKPRMLGPEMGNYVVMQTCEMDEATKFPKKPGRINGGFYEKSDKAPSTPSVVVAVEDIRAAMKRVEEAGGKIIGGQKPGEPDDIPGVGLYLSFTDSEGNSVGMIQPAPMM
ncbi:MAG: VOC family protein [Patescibacteria group bacterium]